MKRLIAILLLTCLIGIGCTKDEGKPECPTKKQMQEQANAKKIS